MTSTTARPLGITIIAIVVILSGIAQVITAIGLLEWIDFIDVPASGDPQVSGWASLIVGVINIAVGAGLFTLRRWAWVLAVVAMGLAVGSAAWAIIRHGLDGIVWVSIATGVVSLIILAYLLQGSVRDAFRRP